jgi:hypothetical protein
VTDCFGRMLELERAVGLRQLYFGAGHWHADFLSGRTTGSGRVLVATNGCFGDVEPEGSRLERRAALEKPDGRVWVGSVSSPP